MRADFVYALLLEPDERCLQSGDTGKIERACFKFVGQKARRALGVTEAAGAADDERRDFVNDILAQQQAADALRRQQAFMPGEGEGVDVQLLHIERQDACALRTVDDEAQAVLLAEAADLCERLHCAADVAGVRHDDGLGVGAHKLRQSVQAQCALCVAGDAAEGDGIRLRVVSRELCADLLERTHDSVMLHSGNEHMVAATQQSLDDDVQAFGDILCKNYIFTVLCAEKIAEQLARRVDEVFAAGGAGAAADVGACVCDILVNGVSNHLRLGEGGAGIVEINLLHKLILLCYGYSIILLSQKLINQSALSINDIGRSASAVIYFL